VRYARLLGFGKKSAAAVRRPYQHAPLSTKRRATYGAERGAAGMVATLLKRPVQPRGRPA